ncbi:MAG: MarR family transcriptional regulator [Pseudomonadota bacterium]
MLDLDGISFFGRSLETLQELMLEQAVIVFDRAGVVVPPRSCSLLLAIGANDNMSASDLSRRLGYSHQLVLQKIPKLLKLGLIRVRQDEVDRRRRVYSLTEFGVEQAARLEVVLPAFGDAYRELFLEVGDLPAVLARTSQALQRRPLDERISGAKGEGLCLVDESAS